MSIDRDVWAGLFFMGLAALGLFIGSDYAFGTPARMGAGFLPKLLCWALLGLGGLIVLTGIVRRGEPMEAWAWGQLLAILCAVLVFGASLEGLGLEFAILGAILVGGTADPTPNRLERTLLVVMALTLAVFLWPGTAAKLAPLTKDWPVAGPLTILAGTAMAVLVLSHARRVPLWVLVERLALAVGLGIACIIIFVDGLGLALKSAYVIDGWNVVKSVVFRPLISIFR